MKSDALIIDNVGKAYVEYKSEIRRFARWFGAGTQPDAEHWVLRHISFRVAAGEAIGIVGQNGAGKSTLLKMVVGTTRPSEGAVFCQGRVSALLELGLGFNAELTGRENVVHSAGLMGHSQADISQWLPEVEAFAEIGEYFDQPLRTYSSGMQMRLAFSVATAVRPDVLIVDEALAVGDAYFVHKCFQRIRDFRAAGTTLLIVSHDPGVIQSPWHRAVLVERGRMISHGEAQEVRYYYNALIAEKENSTVRTGRDRDGRAVTESGSGEVAFSSLEVLDVTGQPIEYLNVGESVVLRARIRAHENVPQLVFGYMIRDRLGQPVFGTNTHHTNQVVFGICEGDEIEYRANFDANFGVGTYSISVALSSTDTHLVHNYQWKDLALLFTVANIDKSAFVGTAWVPPAIEVTAFRRDSTQGCNSVADADRDPKPTAGAVR